MQVLERLAEKHPVPRLILDYRGLMKLKNTYLDNLTDEINPRTGRIHGHFNQTGAGTGRLSMSDPNLQNIPIRTDEGRRIRLAFVPGDAANNVLLGVDYSQIELRLLAHFTQEPALLQGVRRRRGRPPNRGGRGVWRAAGRRSRATSGRRRRRSTSASSTASARSA